MESTALTREPETTDSSTQDPVTPGPTAAVAASPALGRSAVIAVALSFVALWAVVLPFILTGSDVPATAIFLGRGIPLLASLLAWRLTRPAPLGQLWRTSSTTARRLLLAAGVAVVVMAGTDLVHTALTAVTGPGPAPQPQWLSAVLLLVPVMVVFSISTFGEEVLWRGHLRTAWEHWGFWRSATAIAVVWMLFHLPLVVAYHLGGVMDVRVNLALWLSLGPLSVLLCALVDRLRLVWVAVLAHAFPFGVIQQQLLPRMEHLVDGTLVAAVGDLQYWAFHATGAAICLAAAVLVRRLPARTTASR